MTFQILFGKFDRKESLVAVADIKEETVHHLFVIFLSSKPYNKIHFHYLFKQLIVKQTQSKIKKHLNINYQFIENHSVNIYVFTVLPIRSASFINLI